MRVNDAISGSVLVLVGGTIWGIALTFRPMPGQDFGPSLFPSLIGAILIACGAVLIVQGWRRRAGEPWIDWSEWSGRGEAIVNAALLIAALVFYILAAPSLGFFPSAIIIMSGLMLRLRPLYRWPSSLAIAVVATTVIYIFFGRLLQVPLPRDFISSLF